MTGYSISLFVQHAEMLAASGIPPEHASTRGYVSVDTKVRLDGVGVTKAGRNVPGLLVPQLRKDGSVWGYQYRPDQPRTNGDGKPVKYETPVGQRNGIDVPPGVGPLLDDPAVPLWVTEGVKKADAAAARGLACVALPGVWSWRGRNDAGGKTAVSDWHDIALDGRRVVLAFDSDVTVKPAVRRALDELGGYLTSKGAKVEYAHLPDDGDGKTGLDDYLAGHDVDELQRLVRPDAPEVVDSSRPTSAPSSPSRPSSSPATPVALPDALATFRRWLHLEDTEPVLAVAATLVANLAEGDPVWLLVVGPPSGGKTEILSSCAGLPWVVPAATVSEAALLSGTSAKERARDATGGLLRMVGASGVLLAKDFTSVLSQNLDTAKAAMAALREVYDGSWDRPVGSDGGRVLKWAGKCGFIGGVTPTYDRFGTIVSTLGDRFLLLRLPDVDATAQAMAALGHDDHEKAMRAELAAAMAGLVAGADTATVHRPLTDDDRARLVKLASFAAVARTQVERNGYTGDLLVKPQPEGPARLVKALRRLRGGLLAIGADDDTAWSVLARVAYDCAPAIRMPLLRALLNLDEPETTAKVAERAAMATKTADRQLDDLAMLGMVERTKKGEAVNAANLWTATDWLHEHFPDTTKARQRTTPHPLHPPKREAEDVDDVDPLGALGSSLSYSEPCANPTHTPRYGDGVWTCPDCEGTTR